MSNNCPNCPICSSGREFYFNHKILNKYDVDYFYCCQCGLLQTETPYWLDEAYANAIADADTGLVARNISTSQIIAPFLFFYLNPNGKYLDFAGGYGMLTRLMRDIGFDFYWYDPYCKNLLAKGFEIDSNTGSCAAVTAFEVLEHASNPIEFIKEALAMAKTSTIIFSTRLFEGNPPPLDWDYYAFETGQHISFYQTKTMLNIAELLGLNYYNFRGIGVFTSLRLSNTLALNITTGKANFLVAKYIKSRMQSKMMSDYNYLIKSTY